MLRRFKRAFNNECGASTLEAVALIAAVMVISCFAMYALDGVIANGKTMSGYTSNTGWFRTEDTTGIVNP